MNSWKGTVRQFLSHFKEKLRLLDSLVPVSDQLPETTRITFLQTAVQQNHDLRQIHVMDSVWRFKTESTDTLTFETYYNLLWDAAHQYDLHHTKKGPQRKAFISQHEEVNDEDGYIIEEEQSFNDSDPEEESSPYSVYQSSFHLRFHRNPTFLLKSGKHFLKAPNKWSLSTTRKSSSTTLHHTLVGARLNLTLHWVSPILPHNKFISIHKMMLKRNHLLTLLPRAW